MCWCISDRECSGEVQSKKESKTREMTESVGWLCSLWQCVIQWRLVWSWRVCMGLAFSKFACVSPGGVEKLNFWFGKWFFKFPAWGRSMFPLNLIYNLTVFAFSRLSNLSLHVGASSNCCDCGGCAVSSARGLAGSESLKCTCQCLVVLLVFLCCCHHHEPVLVDLSQWKCQHVHKEG